MGFSSPDTLGNSAHLPKKILELNDEARRVRARSEVEMRTIEIRTVDGEGEFMGALRDANAVAGEILGELVCMSWYVRARDQE